MLYAACAACMCLLQMSVLGGSHSVLLCTFPFLLLGNVLNIIFQLK
jgi:hypothetical protein